MGILKMDCRQMTCSCWATARVNALLLGLLLASFSQAHAQLGETTSIASDVVGVADRGGGSAGNTASRTSGWNLVPSVGIEETYTDNVNLSSDKSGDWITILKPGIHVDGIGARVKGRFDFQWQENLYARDSARRNLQRSMSGTGEVELIENWLFLEGGGNVAQSVISAFGTQSSNSASLNTNRTETSAYRLAPRIQGHLGFGADYLLRYEATTADSDSSTLPRITTGDWSGFLKGTTSLARLGWSIEANHQNIDYATGRSNNAESMRGTLTYEFDPQIKGSVIVGHESNDYLTLEREGKGTHGVGIDWLPTERTRLSLTKEHRFFGDGHSLTFNHRTPLSAWSYTDTRDVSIPSQQMSRVGLGSIYDLLFAQKASAIPDPIARAQEVNRELQEAGIPANAQVSLDFLSSHVTVTRHQQASFALIGANNTVTFALLRSESQQIGAGVGAVDDYSLSPTIRQRGYSVNWAHQLSALSSLTLLADSTHNIGAGATVLDSTLKSLRLSLTTQLGPKTSANFGLRRVRSESTVGNTYDEHAVTGAVSLKF